MFCILNHLEVLFFFSFFFSFFFFFSGRFFGTSDIFVFKMFRFYSKTQHVEMLPGEGKSGDPGGPRCPRCEGVGPAFFDKKLASKKWTRHILTEKILEKNGSD